MMKNDFKNEILNWSVFSQYRNELFGIAILFILLFHSTIYFDYSRFQPIFSQLNMGVEIFLFLSGMGLYFSYVKKPTYLQFERKRFLTVGVVYLIIALPFCVWQNIVEKRNFIYFLFDWSSLSYWFKEENSPAWYVSLILLLYLLYPVLYKVMFGAGKQWYHSLLVTVAICAVFIAASYYLSRNELTVWNCIERAFTRIPCFIVGCYCGQLIYEKKQFGAASYLFLLLCCMSPLIFDRINFRFRYFLTIIPIMLALAAVLYLTVTVCRMHFIKTILHFFGGMTLELYLTHNFLSEILQYYHMTRIAYYLLAVAVSIPLSYALSRLRGKVAGLGSKTQ